MQITNQIHFRNVQGDILGGLTAAVVALLTSCTKKKLYKFYTQY